FGASVCVFISAGWVRLTRSVAKQGTATNSDRSTPRSAILFPTVPFAPQREVPSPVPTSVKVELVLAAFSRRKKTRTWPTVVGMREASGTRATAKLSTSWPAVLVGRNSSADEPSSCASALSNVSPLVILLGLLRWLRTV